MAIGDAYATPEEFRQFKGANSGRDDVALDVQLKAVSRLLDRRLNQPYGFNKDATGSPSVAIYGVRDVPRPIASTTGIVVKSAYAGSAIDWTAATALVLDSDYELTPPSPAPGWPWTGIMLYGYASTSRDIIEIGSYRGRALSSLRVRVEAIHGWPSVPDEIKWATIEMTSILRGEGIFATGRISELGAGSIDASPDARRLLASLTKQFDPYGGVAFA